MEKILSKDVREYIQKKGYVFTENEIATLIHNSEWSISEKHKTLSDNNMPNIRWHDLRSTFCTLLLKNDFNPKAVSKLMGHAKEIITMDVYGDNKGILADGVTEIEVYIEEVVPKDEDEILQEELLDVVVDVQEYLPEIELEHTFI